MTKTSGREAAALLAVIATAVFFRFYRLSSIPPVSISNSSWLTPALSAIFGVLTVIGLYFLVREIYDRRMAALAGFMMAISFWAVMFSRQAVTASLVPFFLVWSFYFLWRGFKGGGLIDYFWAGIVGGAGFYFSTIYWFAPLIFFFLFINYWAYVKKDFGQDKYEHTRNRLLAGYSLLVLAAFFTALPLIWSHPGFSFSWDVSFAAIGKTLAMFNFKGDLDPLHGIVGAPLIAWPIGIFFLIGFFKELLHWLRRKHGHLSPAHTLLFSWFFVMLLPGFFSNSAPDFLVTLGAMPIAIIFAARGIWWIFEALGTWHDINYPLKQYHERKEGSAFALWVLFILLATLCFYGYYRYFQTWAKSPATTAAFTQNKT
ncbi:MAG TPA: glycosyltransferase family 39 protein [Candidatus Paceibacterota bacterium]|nr:glycosyltransferase family 39 protein [Candidatus Paceibacterota bacterium]